MNKSNVMTQTLLKELLGTANEFSDKGLHFIACRFNGKTHHNLLEFLFNKIHYKQPLIEVLDAPLIAEIKQAFGLEELPDAALVILATGRRPVYGKLGWSEGGYSLLKIHELPKNYNELDDKGKKKADDARELQMMHYVLCERVVELFTRQIPIVEPPVVQTKPKLNNVKTFPAKKVKK